MNAARVRLLILCALILEARRAAEWADNDADLDNSADLGRWQVARAEGLL